jgi:MoaA/NifB/PqqE/SkfB family radical SAM enzyme
MGDADARARELSKEEHFRVLDQLVEMGTFWLLYSGGEIFARKDFLEIYTYAKHNGFLITLFTNGILINERIADHLLEWPPFSIEITLYGRTKATYEALTGIPGSYERCLHGIELLRARGLPLKLKTVPTTINKHEVFSMKRFAEEELGASSSLIPRSTRALTARKARSACASRPRRWLRSTCTPPRRLPNTASLPSAISTAPRDFLIRTRCTSAGVA